MDKKLLRDDVLILLIEEAGEVIQAATKCLRFGYTRNQPNYGKNDDVLAKEIGDFLGCVDALPFSHFGLEDMKTCRETKIERAEKILNEVSA